MGGAEVFANAIARLIVDNLQNTKTAPIPCAICKSEAEIATLDNGMVLVRCGNKTCDDANTQNSFVEKIAMQDRCIKNWNETQIRLLSVFVPK
jgi:hypothetical protein